jgi:hypothetical protein
MEAISRLVSQSAKAKKYETHMPIETAKTRERRNSDSKTTMIVAKNPNGIANTIAWRMKATAA